MLDGPLQRQMILLKLLHAMNTRPNFGNQYINDPDSSVRQWLSKVKALVDRVSISKSVEFNAALGASVRYWDPAIKSVQIIAYDAIEELKLELEIYQDDQIGKIYEGNESHRFKADILRIMESASDQVFVIDPYFDANTFALYFENIGNFKIKVICSQYFQAVSVYSLSFEQEHGRKVEIKKSKRIHDRILFIDEDCWLVGASLRVRIHNQNMTTAANAHADRKTFGHLS